MPFVMLFQEIKGKKKKSVIFWKWKVKLFIVLLYYYGWSTEESHSANIYGHVGGPDAAVISHQSMQTTASSNVPVYVMAHAQI